MDDEDCCVIYQSPPVKSSLTDSCSTASSKTKATPQIDLSEEFDSRFDSGFRSDEINHLQFRPSQGSPDGWKEISPDETTNSCSDETNEAYCES